MYTSPTNVPEESAESIVSFEADTENIPCIGSLGSLDIFLQISRRDLKKVLSAVCMVVPVYVSSTKYWLAGVFWYKGLVG